MAYPELFERYQRSEWGGYYLIGANTRYEYSVCTLLSYIRVAFIAPLDSSGDKEVKT